MGSRKSGFSRFFILSVLAAILIAFAAILWESGFIIEYKPPKLEDRYWGRGDVSTYKESREIKSFTVKIPDKVLTDLKSRLDLTVYPEPLEDVQHFENGFRSTYLKEVVNYWKNDYDWRIHEATLNKFPQFKTQIDGISVHFLHVKPEVSDSAKTILPLLLLHGWPGSIVEFIHILPLLTTPRPDFPFVFEVICPSIPGYAFSEAPHKEGFGPLQAARIFDKLMLRLKFNKYYVQGGDWGAAISTHMGTLYPERVSGLHVNMIVAPFNNKMFWVKTFLARYVPYLITEQEYNLFFPLNEKFGFMIKESGYLHLQATKPDTIGTALANSPAGLAAYILQLFSTATNKSYMTTKADGGLTEKISLDDLITNVMVYYTTGTITSSVRFYKEFFGNEIAAYQMDRVPVKVPTGLAAFPCEIAVTPQWLASSKYHNIIQYSIMPRGGHFAALEEPKLLSDDLFNFVQKIENPN